MRKISSLPIELALYDTVKHGSASIDNVTAEMARTWQRSIRSIGGFHLATADYAGPLSAQRELFLNGMMREVRETLGGQITWQGFLFQADLTIKGQTYTRHWADLVNRVQAIYTRLGDNLLTNGSVESGNWAAYNVPSVLAQSAVWISDGAWSEHIVADSSADNVLTNGGVESGIWVAYNTPPTLAQSTFWVYEGAESAHIISAGGGDGAVVQAGMVILAGTLYDCQAQVNIITGPWRLWIYRTDTGAALASVVESRTGILQMQCSVPVTNLYAGTVGIILEATTGGAEIYADDVRFQLRKYQGAVIQTGIPIVASKAYDAQMSVDILSGTWRLELYRTDTDAALGSGTENNPGQRTMRASISNTNTYAGNIGARLYCTTIAGEIYADGAGFRETAVQARTSWLAQAKAQTEYGVIEAALLLPGMSDAAANALAATYLAQRSWPRTIPPESFGGQALGQADGLKLTFAGYSFTLRNKYTVRGGTTQAASVHVANLIADSEFVTAGTIAANAYPYQIDDRAPLRAWEVLRDITLAGDAAGARWTCGVYGNRRFSYGPAPTTIDYHYHGGTFLNTAFGAVSPWLARPGLAYLDEMPAGPAGLSGNQADDPHVVFLEEISFDCADWLAGGSGLSGSEHAT